MENDSLFVHCRSLLKDALDATIDLSSFVQQTREAPTRFPLPQYGATFRGFLEPRTTSSLLERPRGLAGSGSGFC